MPQLLIKISDHQKLVILDMIRGRDSYIDRMEKYQGQFQELMAAKKYIDEDSKRVVLFIGKEISHTYGRWIFSPQKFYVTYQCPSYNECIASDSFNNEKALLSGIDADLIILEKHPKLIKNLSEDIKNHFKIQKESYQFLFYFN